MKASAVLGLILLGLPLLAQAGSTQCGWDDHSLSGEYGVTNDVWYAKQGRDEPSDFQLCMSPSYGAGDVSADFKWTFRPKIAGVKAYPHVIYGFDWQKLNTTPKMPVSMAQAGWLKAYTDYDFRAQGKLNISYDIWISKSQLPRNRDITREVMIWVDGQNVHNGAKLVDTAVIAGTTYDVHVGAVTPPVGKWQYIAFVAKKPVNKNWVYLGAFFKYMKSHGLSADDEFVNGVSFGSEITEGSGSLSIRNFKVVGQ